MGVRAQCPKCGAVEVLEIVYGKPTAEAQIRADRGEFELGGCIVTPDDPNRVCTACGARWIDQTDPQWIERQEMVRQLKERRDREKA